jgi:hypothetical protein
MTVGYFNSIGTCNLCSKKLPYFRIQIDSPVYSSPRSQLQIRITPRIFGEKFEIVSEHAHRDQEKFFDEKTGDEKSRDTVPLSSAKTRFAC